MKGGPSASRGRCRCTLLQAPHLDYSNCRKAGGHPGIPRGERGDMSRHVTAKFDADADADFANEYNLRYVYHQIHHQNIHIYHHGSNLCHRNREQVFPGLLRPPDTESRHGCSKSLLTVSIQVFKTTLHVHCTCTISTLIT